MGMTPRWKRLLERLRHSADVNLLDVLPLLTVLLLLTSAPQIWYLRTPLLLLSVAGLVYRRILRTPQFWYVTATLMGATIYLNWESTDNHKYLLCYWCLALCCAFSLPPASSQAALRTTCRWLLGLCMLLAAAWKLATPGYVSGDFFEYTLLVDERFEYLARWAGDATATVLADNRELTDVLRVGYTRGIEVDAVQLRSPGNLRPLVLGMTWWTVLIEGLAAVLFLLPDRRWTCWGRNGVLLVFAVTTYAVATVRGFGWMLMMLGLAQTRESERRLRVAYVAVFLLIQVYTLPIAPAIEMFGDAVGGAPPCCRNDDSAGAATSADSTPE